MSDNKEQLKQCPLCKLESLVVKEWEDERDNGHWEKYCLNTKCYFYTTFNWVRIKNNRLENTMEYTNK